MAEVKIAKLFKNGGDQAVQTWGEFFEFMGTIDVPPDFMGDRPMNVPPQDRDLFGKDA